MKRTLLAAAVAAVAAAALWAAVAQEALPIFDPAALMAKIDETAKGRHFTFAVFGDTYAEESLGELMALVEREGADFSVTVGDLVSTGGGPGSERDWRKLADMAGPFMRRHATWPLIGNHEVRVQLEDPAARRAARQAAIETFRHFYSLDGRQYSFAFGRSKFIFLDWDIELDVDPPHQTAFLEEELADADRWEHVFVFRHRPYFGIGEKSAEEIPNRATDTTRLFSAKGVDAVFSGHEHLYYRAAFDGVTYIQAGSGGGMRRLLRRGEVLPGGSYMGVLDGKFLLHLASGSDRVLGPYEGEEKEGPFRFVVFVTVRGARVSGRVVSVGGEVWESFDITAAGAPAPQPQPVGAAAD